MVNDRDEHLAIPGANGTNRLRDVPSISPSKEHAPILVLDESPAIQDMLCRALDLAGYSSSALAGGERAYAWIEQAIQAGDTPALILLDLSPLSVQKEDAAALLQRLRTRWKPAPPIIVLTTSKHVEEALAGQEWVFCKPFHVYDLLAAIQEVLIGTARSGEA